MFKELKAGILITIVFTVFAGLMYPLAMTGIAQLIFPRQANGSLIARNGKVIGSELIGQNFAKPEYFHPRPSAAGNGYDASASSGSNLGATNPTLIDRLNKGAAAYRQENPAFSGAIPSDAITTSGSGLDPDISPANAEAQCARVASARGVATDQIRSLVSEYTENRTLGVFGEPRLNVLRLNLALDERFPLKR
jgi:potassium-transporting ATPase KdpC subunit